MATARVAVLRRKSLLPHSSIRLHAFTFVNNNECSMNNTSKKTLTGENKLSCNSSGLCDWNCPDLHSGIVCIANPPWNEQVRIFHLHKSIFVRRRRRRRRCSPFQFCLLCLARRSARRSARRCCWEDKHGHTRPSSPCKKNDTRFRC